MEGYYIEVFSDVWDVMKKLNWDWFGVVFLDINMLGMDGVVFLCEVLKFDDEFFIVMLIGYGDIFIVVEFMCLGVYDFIEKLFFNEMLFDVLKCVGEKCVLVLENCELKDEFDV